MKVFRPADLGVGVRLAAMGSYLPARVMDNAALVEAGAALDAEEMARLSGVRARRWVSDDEATSDLAREAGRAALARAGVPADAVDRLILATVSSDHPSPSTACLVQHALGLRPVPAFDVTASCSGFVYALDLAARAVATGEDVVLAVAADVRSRFVDLADRATCALFGDGAAAAVVTRGEPGKGLVAIGLLSDGRGAKSVYVPAGGSREPATAETVAARRHTIRMEEGPAVYLAAVEGMIDTGEALLAAEGLGWGDVDWLVPHQPNRRILDRLARLAKIDPEKVVVDIEERGNTSAAAVGLALERALSDRVRPGDRVLVVAAGAGYTAGAALLIADEALVSPVRLSGPRY